ncbi:MAG TPA: carbohydrate kinase family protein [Patescibacteria group bacterium]|nr:carbohydrate kinase family protein [Patescibacteria group bacterium]
MPHAAPFDLVAIGDSTLDVFLHMHEATLECQLHRERCLLCLEYANKIPVESMVKVPGAGSASNIAVGAAKLGMRAAIVSVLGNDEVGKEILARWKRAGVSDTYVQFDAKHETNYSTVLDFQGERTILSYNLPRIYRLPTLDGAQWIFYASLGPKHERLEKQLLRHLHKHPAQKLAFNPGVQQLERNLSGLKPVIARSNLFIVNKEEAERLLQDGDRPMANLLMSFVHLGAKIVVITDGPKGSYATDGKEIWSLPIFPGREIERTGAGDAFAVAFLHELFRGHPIPEAMRAGTASAWSVIQKIGPQSGLLDPRGLRNVLQKFKRIQPKKMTF